MTDSRRIRQAGLAEPGWTGSTTLPHWLVRRRLQELIE